MRIALIVLLSLFALNSCTTHERDNRFDKKGMAYNPSPDQDYPQLAEGSRGLLKISLFSCSEECVASWHNFMEWLRLLVDLLTFLDKHDVLQKSYSVPGLPNLPDLPSIPDLPKLPDFKDGAESFYASLEAVDAQEALQMLNLTNINARQYHIPFADTIESTLLAAQILAMDYQTIQDLSDSLETILRVVSLTTVQSQEFRDRLTPFLDSVPPQADSLVALINANSATYTQWLRVSKGDSIRLALTDILETQLNSTPAPLLHVAVMGMTSDLLASLEPVRSSILGGAIKELELPDTTRTYQQEVQDFVANALEQLFLHMEQVEMDSKNGSADAPADLVEFFEEYRGIY